MIEDEFMDNTDKELILLMLEKEHQFGSSSRSIRRTIIDRSREKGIDDYSMTMSQKI